MVRFPNAGARNNNAALLCQAYIPYFEYLFTYKPLKFYIMCMDGLDYLSFTISSTKQQQINSLAYTYWNEAAVGQK